MVLRFVWKTSIDPQTFGIWLSQPFIVKQSNGKELAVLLMDTQGLFDDQYNERDWSTIVGISLLMSSCFIFNVFNDITENVMTTLDAYINYGLRAVESNIAAKENIPFQTLLFLIRDWNTPTDEFKFGMTGGMNYLEEKLKVKDNQSAQAKNVRQNLQKCFKEVRCFLMPQFGEVMEEKDFDGSFNKLRERFRDKLKEFISTILNPEELVPKMIYGTPITCGEFCQQFQSFIEIFNKEDLPESHLILEAKAKFSDTILLRKIKDKHMNQLQTLIHSKPFVTRKELEIQNQSYKTENIERFESEMKSKNPSLVDKLSKDLNKNYLIVFNKNEDQRDHYMEERRDMCSQQFKEALNEELTNRSFIEPEVLEQKFKTFGKKSTDYFKEGYVGEEEKLFKDRFFELSELIKNSEDATRTDNYRRLHEFENTIEGLVGNVVDFYNSHMDRFLTENVYLTKEQFKDGELTVKTKTLNKFRKEYDFGKQSTNVNFFLKVDQKLSESKLFFKKKNQDKSKSIVEQTERILSRSIERYRREMDEILHLFQTEDDLSKSHRIVFGKVFEELQNTLPFKAVYFLTPYVEAFNRETNQLYDTFKTQLIERIQSRRQKYINAMNESKDHYIEEMSQSMEGQEFFPSDELKRIHKNRRISALKVYEQHLEGTDIYDPLFIGFQSNLKELIGKEFDTIREKNEQIMNSDERLIEVIINDSLNDFNTSMGQITQNCNSDVDLSNRFVALKEELLTNILDNNTVSNTSLVNQRLSEFETHLNQSFNGFKAQLEERKLSVINDYNNKVTRANDSYKQKMEEILKENEYITDEEFNEYHEKTKSLIISELTQQLKPVFHIKVQSFVDMTDQLIGEEYEQYFVVNDSKRNNRLELIKNLSKEYIIEYKKRMYEDLDQTLSEDELQERHSQILDEILERSRSSSDLGDKMLISLQVTHTEREISNIFDDILEIFRKKFKIFTKNIDQMFEKSKTYFENEMDSLFINNELYPSEDLTKHQLKLRSETLRHFEDQLKDNGIESKHLRELYLDQLNDFIDGTNQRYLRKNEENKLLFNESLNQMSEHIKTTYKETMEKAFDLMLSEEDLNKKHYDVMTALLKEFNECIQLLDMTLLETSQKELQKFMKSELKAFQNELNQKINKIVKSYKTMSKVVITNYNQVMDNIVKSEELFSGEEFQGLHEAYRKEAIDSFESHLKEYPCAEANEYFLQLKREIEEEFIKFKEIYEMKIDLKLKGLKLALTDFGKMYENEMKQHLNNIKSKEGLEDCHREVKDKLIRIFCETYPFRDSNQIKPYIKTLEENFEEYLNDFYTLLELRIENQETLIKSLRIEVRRYYKEEMQKCFHNKLFVPKLVVNKCHKLVLKNTIDKFSPERGDLSDDDFSQLAADSVEDIFNNINQENEMKRPTDSPRIGIDLGTTNSCVAFFKPDARNSNNIVVIPNELGHLTTPSVVSYRDNSIVSVGDEAKEMIHRFPRNTISSVKRLIGRQYDDESVQKDMNLWSYKVVDDGNNNPKVSLKVDGQDMVLYPEQVSAKVLKKMKEIAESHLGCEVTKAVITVPAYFNDGQKEATKDAGKLAGLEVLRIINEPTAAAIAFKVDRNEEKESRNVLIFDFGGGTFDVSILEIKRGVIEVKAVDGNNHLGGDDIDTCLIKYCLEHFTNEFKVKVVGTEGESAMCRLRNMCEEHKKRLSNTTVESTVIEIDNFYQTHDLRVPLTRDKFEELNNHLFVQSIDLVQRALAGIDKSPSDIDDVVLVGGTTRIPKVQEMLTDFFDGKPLNHWVNPDEAVAKGAAIQAAYLNGESTEGCNELELKDVTPLSLGIRIKGNKMSVIIPRNSPVPTTITKQYYTSENYQTVVGIKIFEGEKELTKDNHLLGQFDLSGIPRALQGEQPIDVTFSLNDEGILKVKAKIVNTGGEEDIEINEHKGRLTTEKIEQLMSEENFGQYFGTLFK